jgi:hypothetical protein
MTDDAQTSTVSTPESSPPTGAATNAVQTQETTAAGQVIELAKAAAAANAERAKPAGKPTPKQAPLRRFANSAKTDKAAKTPAKEPTANKTKPTPAAAQGFPAQGFPAKFVKAFTRTFQQLLGPFDYKQVVTGSEPRVITFASADIRVELTNPGKSGGSAIAPYSVTRKNRKTETGTGRNALADVLGVPRLAR